MGGAGSAGHAGQWGRGPDPGLSSSPGSLCPGRWQHCVPARLPDARARRPVETASLTPTPALLEVLDRHPKMCDPQSSLLAPALTELARLEKESKRVRAGLGEAKAEQGWQRGGSQAAAATQG